MMTPCGNHPLYSGLTRPSLHARSLSDCETCWAIYLGISETCRNCGCQQNDAEETAEIDTWFQDDDDDEDGA